MLRRLKDWLDPGSTGALSLNGDPHITTLDGTHYDFQGAGEYVVLRDPGTAEIQVRQAPIATTFNPGPDAYHGLATCVSLNTAVAARVGKRRITYQPNVSGVPDHYLYRPTRARNHDGLFFSWACEGMASNYVASTSTSRSRNTRVMGIRTGIRGNADECARGTLLWVIVGPTIAARL